MFNSFFKPKVECPRCLGKGNVDWEDIKRLGQELRWRPGKCAYCNGKGKVAPEMITKVKADTSYLSLDIGEPERKRLFMGDEAAIQRAQHFNSQMEVFIAQIEYLHFMGKMDAETIVDFFLIGKPGEQTSVQEKQELIEYIERVVTRNKK